MYGSDVYSFPYQSATNMRIIRKNLKSADSIASTSYAMALQTTSLIDIDVNNINITPFGVDINKFSKKKVEKDFILIGSIKKLAPKYGLEYGIRAIDYLVNNLIDTTDLSKKIKYYIYGDGPQKKELEDLIRDLDLDEIVYLKGRIPNDEVPNALNEFDIFLGTSVSDSESFGVAIVEAMACEVPVIVTDVDGFKEVVDNGNVGVMVPRKDYKEMAKQILRLINDEHVREKLGKIERDRVIDKFSWDNNVKNMENIYRRMINL